MFDAVSPEQLVNPRYSQAASACDILTCWGDGRVNWQRATEQTLRQQLSPPLDLTQIANLITLRRAFPPLSLSSALDTLGLTAARRNAAADILTDGSRCHSLWLIMTEGSKTAYRMYVQDDSKSTANLSSFEW